METITEATVTKWLKKKGDTVVTDEAVVELETDKVNLEVPAPASGVISEINSKSKIFQISHKESKIRTFKM